MRANVTTELGGRLALFERATLEEVDFRRAGFDIVASPGCVFLRCDFRGVELGAKFQPLFSARPQSTFRESRFDGADLRGVRAGQARFEGCTFDGARIEAWDVSCAEFVDCHFSGPIARTRFHGRPWGPRAGTIDPPRAFNEFHGNDFREADLVETVFVGGVDIAAQHWPANEAYLFLDRIHQRITRAHSQLLRWKEGEARREALTLLQATSHLYARQKDIVLRRGSPPTPTSPETEARVWDLLARILD